jgi:hypothetical protein
MVPIDLSAPVFGLMEYIEILFEPNVAKYANLPEGSVAIETGKGPVTTYPLCRSRPVAASTVRIDRVPANVVEARFAAYAKRGTSNMLKVSELETPPPGAELETETAAFPLAAMSLAGIWAVT